MAPDQIVDGLEKDEQAEHSDELSYYDLLVVGELMVRISVIIERQHHYF